MRIIDFQRPDRRFPDDERSDDAGLKRTIRYGTADIESFRHKTDLSVLQDMLGRFRRPVTPSLMVVAPDTDMGQDDGTICQ